MDLRELHVEYANLLSNGACEVHRRASRLECETGPTVFDWALAALAGCGGAVALRFVVDAHGSWNELFPAMVLLLGCLFGASRVHRRMSASGRVTLDRDTRELVRTVSGRERRWAFSEIRRIALREDGFDASRPDLFPTSPSWLEVELADGTLLHIAKGSADELEPIVRTLDQWQVRAAS
jgi:hypothetical protein